MPSKGKTAGDGSKAQDLPSTANYAASYRVANPRNLPKDVHIMRTLAGKPLYEGDVYEVEQGAKLERLLADGYLVEVSDEEA